MFIYNVVLLLIDVNMPKTPAKRAGEYRSQKKLFKQQKPPAQCKQEYTARQKTEKFYHYYWDNETLINFSGSLELLIVNPDNPKPSSSRDDGNILYNYLLITSGQSGRASSC